MLLVFQACYNKVPQTCQLKLKATEKKFLSQFWGSEVQNQRYKVKMRVLVGTCCLWRLEERSHTLPLPAFVARPHALAGCPITVVSKANIFSSLSAPAQHHLLLWEQVCRISLCPSLLQTLMISGGTHWIFQNSILISSS